METYYIYFKSVKSDFSLTHCTVKKVITVSMVIGTELGPTCGFSSF